MHCFNPDSKCRYCNGQLFIERLKCNKCGTVVEGNFKLATFADLSAEEQDFVFEFILGSGSFKTMAEKLKLSYPTIRNRLDKIIKKLNAGIASKRIIRTKKERVLELTEQGKLSVDAAEEIIKDIL